MSEMKFFLKMNITVLFATKFRTEILFYNVLSVYYQQYSAFLDTNVLIQKVLFYLIKIAVCMSESQTPLVLNPWIELQNA